MLSDTEQLMKKCRDKRDEALVKDFISLWRKLQIIYKQQITASKSVTLILEDKPTYQVI